MNIDYKKIVDFLLDNNINKKGLAGVLKEVLKEFCMMDADPNSKRVLLKSRKSSRHFILMRRQNGIIIVPTIYKNITLTEDFEQITEIRVNNDNDVVLSNIKVLDNDRGIYVSGSNWHVQDDDKYTQVIGRIFVIRKDNLARLTNKVSIEMFISQYNSKRNDIFCDLYWDSTSFFKNYFIDIEKITKVQINDGYKKEEFSELYKRYNDKVNTLLNNNI